MLTMLMDRLQSYSYDVRAVHKYCTLLANIRPFPFAQDRPFVPCKVSRPCHLCKKPCTSSCSGCNFYAYCSKECQSEEWIMHKNNCYRHSIKSFYDLVRAAWCIEPKADHTPYAIVLSFDQNERNIKLALSCLSRKGVIVDAALCILCRSNYILKPEELEKLEATCTTPTAKQNLDTYKQWLLKPKEVRIE